MFKRAPQEGRRIDFIPALKVKNTSPCVASATLKILLAIVAYLCYNIGVGGIDAPKTTEDAKMKRVPLTDGSGKWFDMDATTKYEEDANWNGSNMISAATGSQWEHETLYRTKGGRWILYHWSQWQGSMATWTEISDSEAAAWLVRNDHDPHRSCESEYVALQIA